MRKIFTKNKKTLNLHFWNPYKSKIAAAIFNGLEIFPFKENTKIFYHTDDLLDETSLHFSNILELKGKIFTKNDELNIKTSSLDIFFIDIPDDEYILDSINGSNNLLKTHGFLIFSTSIISKSQNSKDPINFLIRQMKQKNFSLIQEVNLSNYFRDHILVIMQKNK
jgi:fibrillarin-like rRNA methylase|tara:strand:- start:781 stop:1278 length:498 start_codon:yes stop_codon:yes gene_type:complete